MNHWNSGYFAVLAGLLTTVPRYGDVSPVTGRFALCAPCEAAILYRTIWPAGAPGTGAENTPSPAPPALPASSVMGMVTSLPYWILYVNEAVAPGSMVALTVKAVLGAGLAGAVAASVIVSGGAVSTELTWRGVP